MIGYVYKITNADETIVYVGSTTHPLKNRLQRHKYAYQRWIDGMSRCGASIYTHFKEHGVESFGIHLISKYEIEDRRQLHEFEQLVIDSTECVNKNRSYRTDEQKREQSLEQNRVYREANRESLREKSRIYQERNKAAINAKMSEKIQCQCGAEHRRSNRGKHLKTMKHQTWLQGQTSN